MKKKLIHDELTRRGIESIPYIIEQAGETDGIVTYHLTSWGVLWGVVAIIDNSRIFGDLEVYRERIVEAKSMEDPKLVPRADRKCITCGNRRIAGIGAKCSDRCRFMLVDEPDTIHDGYVPRGTGVESPDGGGDYIEFMYCLDCGQIQGEFPKFPGILNRPHDTVARD